MRRLDPALLVHRVWRRLYTVRHPDHPWLDPGAIAYLDAHLKPTMTGLEWGSGRSTPWFASRVARLVSIEHNPVWHARVRRALQQQGVANVDLRLIEITPEDLASHDVYWGPHPYVMAIEEFAERSLDLVLIDGQFRQHCVARAIPKIRRGAYLVIDNCRFLPRLADWGVPDDWPLVHMGKSRFLDTAVWMRPS